LAEEHLISKQRPVYPKDAEKANITGTVTVAVLIKSDGTVQIARVTSGPELLRTAAEECVKKWRYTPFLVDGKPSVAQTSATVIFKLGK
jgi:protein TonB